MTEDERHSLALKIFHKSATTEELDVFDATLTKELQAALDDQIKRAQRPEGPPCDTCY